MIPRSLSAVALAVTFSSSLLAQLSQEARFAILHEVIATEGAARLAMPLGGDGLELSDTGQVNREKLQKEIQKNGASITTGRIVNITGLEFGERTIEVELDGGGTKKKGILSRIQIGVGGASSSQTQPRNEDQARGSKITLKFAGRVPSSLTPAQLKDLLNPVLDFNKQSVARAGVDALPLEFKEAVLAKKAAIGMDGNTVILALGRPLRKRREMVNGVPQEDWIYEGRGNRVTFVTFEKDVVVSIREY
jgi:hypothetical protein